MNNASNQLEAARYYALEMQAYRKELRSQKGAVSERLLLSLNWTISNHGQSYIRPAFWLLVSISLTALLLANDRHQWLSTVHLADGWWNPTWNFLNGLALGFLPSHALVGQGREHLAFALLVATLLISTFTWHLLVAIRRHSKR